LATNTRPLTRRVHPSFSAFVALVAMAAFAASNELCDSVIPRSLFLLASMVIT
jgi:hypothetical protein